MSAATATRATVASSGRSTGAPAGRGSAWGFRSSPGSRRWRSSRSTRRRYPLGYSPPDAGPGGRSPLLTTRSRRVLNMDSAEATLRTLGIELPEPPKPLASYVPVQQVGELLYTSGVIPYWNGELKFKGVVGADVSVKDAARAAEICALNIMALVRQHAGSLH